jgi:hypothetical protein
MVSEEAFDLGLSVDGGWTMLADLEVDGVEVSLPVDRTGAGTRCSGEGARSSPTGVERRRASGGSDGEAVGSCSGVGLARTIPTGGSEKKAASVSTPSVTGNQVGVGTEERKAESGQEAMTHCFSSSWTTGEGQGKERWREGGGEGCCVELCVAT